MNQLPQIENVRYELENVQVVRAGEDFRSHTLPYREAITGQIHMFLDGDELKHTNKLPAKFELVDTARAQFEILDALRETGTASENAFCCPCTGRGCAFIHWQLDERAEGKLKWTMEDLGGNAIGQHEYSTTMDVLEDCISDLHQQLIDFCHENGIETLKWADRKEPPVAGREYYGSLSELEGNLQTLSTST